MRVIVCGGRTFAQPSAVMREIVRIAREHPQATIVHGNARGADTLARIAAEDLGMRTEAYPARWDRFGAAAGPIRNQEMIDAGADLVIAFPGGRGTADLVARARKAGVQVRLPLPASHPDRRVAS